MGLKDFGAGARCGQCFLIVLNIWFALLGIAMIVLGVFVRAGKVGDNRILQMLRQLDFGGINVGDGILALSAIVIVVGVFTLLLSADGGFGACFRKKGMLILYVVILAIILILEIALLAVWIKFVYGVR
ncbi:uncharacterized protein LOC128244156 [Mya arenaria]|uniref:uncharacterized protein LOC128244156 n=1 Tax=Mya arenaria TaxID=6604 RepID=UPI0022E38688|nr:uncharacterized protein LOC128244156 [Mya arenaria]